MAKLFSRMTRLLVLLAALGGLTAGLVGCESTGGSRSVGSDGHAGHSH